METGKETEKKSFLQPRADKDEIVVKVKAMMADGENNFSAIAREIGVPVGTLYSWRGRGYFGDIEPEEAEKPVDPVKQEYKTETCHKCGGVLLPNEMKWWHRGWICGECASVELDASLKPMGAVEAESHNIAAEELKCETKEETYYCCRCGEPAVAYYDGWYCPDCGTESPILAETPGRPQSLCAADDRGRTRAQPQQQSPG